MKKRHVLAIALGIFVLAVSQTCAEPETEGTPVESLEQEGAPMAKLVVEHTLGTANTDQHISGNARRFWQYGTPPEGTYLSRLTLRRLSPYGHSVLDLSIRDIGEPSAGGEAWLAFSSGKVVFRGSRRRSSFYRDWSSAGEPLRRRDGRYDLTFDLGGYDPGDELTLTYSDVAVAGQYTLAPEDWLGSSAGLRYAGSVGGWATVLGIEKEAFSFRQGPQFSGNTTTATLQLVPLSRDRTLVEASATTIRTSLDNNAGRPRSYAFGVQGTHLVTDDLTLTGDLSHNEITQSIAQNAYARRNSSARVAAYYQAHRNTAVEVGGQVIDVAYVNGRQTDTVSTRVRNIFVDVTARVTEGLKIKGHHSRRWADNRPVAFDIANQPTYPLTWSRKDDQSVQVSYTPGWRTGVTGAWRKLFWQNADIATHNTIISRDLSGWWVPRDDLTLYAAYLKQDYGLFGIADLTPYRLIFPTPTPSPGGQ